MSLISLIVAADKNNAIGKSGQLPWHLPNDLRFFKNTTWGMPVIMGRKTFESVGKPLAGRTNIVITRNLEWQFPDVIVVTSLNEAIEQASRLEVNEVFITGGGKVYAEALPIANRVYLTRVNTQISEADTWFPILSNYDWELESERPFFADEKHAFDYSFQCWKRKNS